MFMSQKKAFLQFETIVVLNCVFISSIYKIFNLY